MEQPIVKVRDVLYPRLRAPDLDRMESFLADFGMVRAARTDSALYMRGVEGHHHLHVCEKGEPGLVGWAFLAASAGDLDKLAATEGASAVHEIDEPGGGRRVTLTDPYGFTIELVHGIASVAPLPEESSRPLNLGDRIERVRSVKRLKRGPARVRRMGHLGINVPDVDEAFDWYHRHFGLLRSDSVAIADFTAAVFSRCDRGEEPTDHHTFLFQVGLEGVGLNHCSFEMQDLDDLWIGHEHLAEHGYNHNWGIGRHTLGSQMFDYWRDPWGQIHEHFTDGDLLDAGHEPGRFGIEDAASQWGPQMPDDFGRTIAS